MAQLFNPDPAAYLPHRYPFQLLDRVVDLVPGVYAAARTSVSSAQQFPQVLLIEAVAQLAGILTVQQEGEGGFLAAVTGAEFGDIPVAGDDLAVSVRLVKSFGRLFMVDGEVFCGESCLLKVQLTLGAGRL